MTNSFSYSLVIPVSQDREAPWVHKGPLVPKDLVGSMGHEDTREKKDLKDDEATKAHQDKYPVMSI